MRITPPFDAVWAENASSDERDRHRLADIWMPRAKAHIAREFAITSG